MSVAPPKSEDHEELMRKHAEIKRYRQMFEDAFDELHSAVTKKAAVPGQVISAHHDYPQMSMLDSGFPHFSEAGFFQDKNPRHYVRLLRPRGLFDMFIGDGLPAVDLPKGAELAAFLRSHKIGERIKLSATWDRKVDNLVADTVERYIHLYGLSAPIDAKRRDALILPMIFGTVFRKLDLRLVVPITMTHFEVDHYSLTETTYIARIPKKLQLARARINTLGSGAVGMVVGAATHAFVSSDWSLDVEDVDAVGKSLSQSSANVLEAVDTFFGALRVATGVSTGYAQLLWMPKHWALEYFCELTPIYGATLRRYPSEYDNYRWVARGETVTSEDLKEVRRIFKAATSSESEAVRLALSRLSGCLTRTDAADAILDGTIGLELLLGDDQSQSLSYKLRLRAAALALLHADPAHPATAVALKVKRLYEARSGIVHGKKKKQTKKATEPTDTSYATERLLASDLLRFVLNVLLTHPEYLNPAKIDEGLLLRGDEVTPARFEPAKRKKRQRIR